MGIFCTFFHAGQRFPLQFQSCISEHFHESVFPSVISSGIPKLGDHRWVWENLKFLDGLLLDGYVTPLESG